MELVRLIESLEVVETSGAIDIHIKGIAYDSRKVQKDFVFVCIEGTKADGHDYIDKALELGAKVLVVQKEIFKNPNITIIKVKDTRRALSQLAANYYGKPTTKMNIIGVTGTNGKTTTTHLIKNILEENGIASGLIGTISYKILDREYKASNTTPESLELQGLFKEMEDLGVNSCVMEVSSHSLEMHRVADVSFKIGVFTNLTPDHMDFHNNIENYRKAKSKLFYQTSLGNIINMDDEHGRSIADEIKSLSTPLITYGIHSKADIYAENIQISSKGTKFTLVTPKYKGQLVIGTPGMFSVYNSLAAASVCYVLDYDFDQTKKGMESIKGVPGRFELVQDIGDRVVIVDYAHTPDALENVLKTIKEFTVGNIITVFGCGGDRDKTKRPMMGEIAGNLSNYCIITSDNPRSEEPFSIIKDVEVGIKNTNCKYKMIIDRKDAIREALKISCIGDVVLIAGKGHETYQIIGEQILDFDDRKITQELLREDKECLNYPLEK